MHFLEVVVFLHTGKVYPEASQTAWVNIDHHLLSADHFSVRHGKTQGQVALRYTIYILPGIFTV